MDWQENMRNLWIERSVWIQNYITSLVTGRRDLGYVSTQAILNGTRIANVFSQFYGVEVGTQIDYYLTQQILLLAELASTIKSGRDVDPLRVAWDTNAEGLIEVLLRVNPFWDATTWRELIQEQFTLQRESLIYLSDNQYAQGMANLDLTQDNARRTANLIIFGIEQQLAQQAESRE